MVVADTKLLQAGDLQKQTTTPKTEIGLSAIHSGIWTVQHSQSARPRISELCELASSQIEDFRTREFADRGFPNFANSRVRRSRICELVANIGVENLQACIALALKLEKMNNF